MVINNKDGSVYKLRGPNPLMKDQQEWDRSKLNLINMSGWKSEIVEDARNPIEKFKEDFNVINIGEELFEGPEEPQTKTIKAKDFIDDMKAAEKPVEKPVLNVDEKLARMLRERGAEFYCAPVIGKKTHTDNLYGDSYNTLKYGTPFVFDAVEVDQSDLQLQIWSIKQISKDSVIYKKVRDGGERWWRVKDTEEKTGGYLSICIISDSNPDFS